jgi:hypothetical protein
MSFLIFRTFIKHLFYFFLIEFCGAITLYLRQRCQIYQHVDRIIKVTAIKRNLIRTMREIKFSIVKLAINVNCGMELQLSIVMLV